MARLARGRPPRWGRGEFCRHGAQNGARDAPTADGAVVELEHYPGMTELSIARMIDAAKQRFDVSTHELFTEWGL